MIVKGSNFLNIERTFAKTKENNSHLIRNKNVQKIMDRAFEEKYSKYMEKVFCFISHKNKFIIQAILFSTPQISKLKKRLARHINKSTGKQYR